MFTLRDRRTGELFDRWSDLGDKRRCLLERSWAGVFRNHLLVKLPVDDLCRHLDERMGRPSKDLHVVIGVLLLQQLLDLSDAATVEALAFNMAWHYALDTRSEADSYFCELGIHFALVSPTFGFRGCDDRRLGPCRGPARAAPPAGAVGRKAGHEPANGGD